MNNDELNNENKNNPSSNLQDYEIEVSDKKGLFSRLFDKLKTNKNQKLLDSGNYKKTTNRSISSLWGFGDFRASIFTSLDNMRKAISSKFSRSSSNKNTLAVEIIGEENLQKQDVKNISTSPEKEVIIPPSIQDTKAKNIVNNSVSIEVTNIDTSAINEKENNAEKGKEDDINTTSNDSKKHPAQSDKNAIDER